MFTSNTVEMGARSRAIIEQKINLPFVSSAFIDAFRS
jgi:hypothetical protein